MFEGFFMSVGVFRETISSQEAMADELRKNEYEEPDEEKQRELSEDLPGSTASSSEEETISSQEAMADKLRNNETKEQDEERHKELSEELSGSLTSSSEEAESKHEFSSPWQNSDLVLIIEDQKFHVHRLILEMSSPVLCHIFKETDSNEVLLLRTKVSDFIELLRVIYPQFESKITLENIEHIYRLAKDYEIESVMKVCKEYLVQVEKTTTNAMQILLTAQLCDADKARKQCYGILKGLTVAELKGDQHFEDLDEESLRNVLLSKAERLEKCLREIQPQLVGLIDCVLYLWLFKENKEKMGGSPKKCPVHHSSSKARTSMQTRIKCTTCRAMFAKMARNSGYNSMGDRYHHYSVAGTYFDEKIVDVLQEMFSLLKM